MAPPSRGALHLLEQMCIGSAHREHLRVPLQPQFESSIGLAMHGRDGIDIDDRPAMNLPERLGVEFRREFLDRLADHEFAVGGDDERVLVVGAGSRAPLRP